MTFMVIDNTTGKEPDVDAIARNEEWAKNLGSGHIECFAIEEDGTLILVDMFGNIAYTPVNRFMVIDTTEQEEYELSIIEIDNTIISSQLHEEYRMFQCPACKHVIQWPSTKLMNLNYCSYCGLKIKHNNAFCLERIYPTFNYDPNKPFSPKNPGGDVNE